MTPEYPLPPAADPEPPKKKHRKLAIGGGIAGALLVLIIIGTTGGSKSPAPVTPSVPLPSSVSALASIPGVSSPPSAQPSSAPAMTTAQQQAVQAAQGYLNLGSGFSYESLFQQLTSSYGSGFSAANATFAIGYLRPDWDQQAVEAAKGYLALGTGFSRDSLIQQLTSSDGDGFTQAQAEYAVGKAGL